MKMTYSPGADALGIELVEDGRSARCIEVSDDCVVDLDAGGRVISIEILRASAQYSRAELERLGSAEIELTLAEAAAESGLTVSTLKNQIHNGKLEGTKRGRDWVITRTALVNYLEARDEAGRPATNARAARLQGKLVGRAAKGDRSVLSKRSAVSGEFVTRPRAARSKEKAKRKG